MNSQADTGQSVPGARRRPRVSKGDLREKALLDAAEEQLRHSSVAELTMDSVARKAGITRSAAYFYFGSKEDVVHAVIERATGHLFTGLDAAGQAEADTALQQALNALLDNWRQHAHIFRVGIELAAHPGYRHIWTGLIEHGVTLACAAVARDRARGLVGTDPDEDEKLLRVVAWACERNCYLLFTREHTAREESELLSALSVLAHRTLGYTGR